MKKQLTILMVILVMSFSNSIQAQDPFIGEVRLFAGNFAPRGWALCDGQLLAINQYTALFSLLGTMYGGDGRTTFALPDLRGRVPVHAGSGLGLTPLQVGQKGGSESLNLIGISVPNQSENNLSVVGTKTERVGTINNRDPYLTLNYIIAVQGIYPSRN